MMKNNISFEIIGKVPPKKNLWHVGRGHIYADRSINEFNNSAYLQIKKQLGNFKTIKEPVTLDVCFMVDDRPDMDNLLGCLFDTLQNCGLIANDRQIRRVNMRREKVKSSESKTFVNIIYE